MKRALVYALALVFLAVQPSFGLAPASHFSGQAGIAEELRNIEGSEEFARRTALFLDLWKQGGKKGMSFAKKFRELDTDHLDAGRTLNFRYQVYPLGAHRLFMQGKIITGPLRDKVFYCVFSKAQDKAFLMDANGFGKHLEFLSRSQELSPPEEKMFADGVREYEAQNDILSRMHGVTHALSTHRARLANKIFHGLALPRETWWQFMEQTSLRDESMTMRAAALQLVKIFTEPDLGAYLPQVLPREIYGDAPLWSIARDLAGKSYAQLGYTQHKLIADHVFHCLSPHPQEHEWLQHLALGSPWGDWAYFMAPAWAHTDELKSFFATDVTQPEFVWEEAMELSEPGYWDMYASIFKAVLPEDWKDDAVRARSAKVVWDDFRWLRDTRVKLQGDANLRLKSLRLVSEVKPLSQLHHSLIVGAREAIEDLARVAHDVRSNLVSGFSALTALKFIDGAPSFANVHQIVMLFDILKVVKNSDVHVDDDEAARAVLRKLDKQREMITEGLRNIQRNHAQWLADARAWQQREHWDENDNVWIGLLEDMPMYLERAFRILKAGHKEEATLVDLSELIRKDKIIKSLSSDVAATIKVDMSADAFVPKVLLPGHEFMARVFHQIFTNAKEAMGEGVIHIRVTGSQDQRWARLEIEDEGPGIPNSIRSHIFEPRFTSGKQEGTGLGLDIAKGLVRDYGGSIWVESREGKGAKFVILLPAADAVERDEILTRRKDLLAHAHRAVLTDEPVPRDLGVTMPSPKSLQVQVFYRRPLVDSLAMPTELLLERKVVGVDAVGARLDVRDDIAVTLQSLAEKLSTNRIKTLDVGMLKIGVLFRQRHKELVRQLLRAGAYARHEDGRIVSPDDDDDYEYFWKEIGKKYSEGKIIPSGNIVFMGYDADAALGLLTGGIDYMAGASDALQEADYGKDGDVIAALTEILGGQSSSRYVSRENSNTSLSLALSATEESILKAHGFHAPGTPEAVLLAEEKRTGRQQHYWDDVLSATDWSRSPEKVVVITAIQDNPWVEELKGIQVDPVTGDKTVRSMVAAWGMPARIVEAVYAGNYVELRKGIESESDPQRMVQKMADFTRILQHDASFGDAAARNKLTHEAMRMAMEAIQMVGQIMPATQSIHLKLQGAGVATATETSL